MNPESSPFRPGQPAPVEFFVGRRAEIERLHGMVQASARGACKIGFVSGERGIGKSSLAHFVRVLAEHERTAAGCHVFLGGVHTLEDMLRRTFDRLLKDSVDKPWHDAVRDFFGDRVRKVGVFGVTLELDIDRRDLSTLAADFVPTVTRLLERLKDRNATLLLILDDINGLAESEGFANWLKSLVDEIATSSRTVRLCMLFVGLEERRRELVKSQPSLARVFELIDIAPWSDAEAVEFYRTGFAAANATLADDGLAMLAQHTGGLPVLAHEIGDAVWRTANSPHVTSDEITAGILLAADVIGRKLLEPQISQAIHSERYRSILRKLATQPRMRFQRTDLTAHLTEAEKRVMDNFLRRMRDLGALQPVPGGRGEYRFPNLLTHLYFAMQARGAKPGT